MMTEGLNHAFQKEMEKVNKLIKETKAKKGKASDVKLHLLINIQSKKIGLLNSLMMEAIIEFSNNHHPDLATYFTRKLSNIIELKISDENEKH